MLVACASPNSSVQSSLATPNATPQNAHQNTEANLASYLVGRKAISDNNFSVASHQFAQTLASDPANTRLMRVAFSSFYINGDIERAALLAEQIEQRGENVNFASEPALILALEERDFAAAQVLANFLHADDASRPLAIIAGAWARALQGQGDAGLTLLLDLQQSNSNTQPYAVFSQSALMNEYLGRTSDAINSARLAIEHPEANVATILNMAAILARNGHSHEAQTVLTSSLSQIFNTPSILSHLDRQTSPLLIPPDTGALLANAILDAAAISNHAETSGIARHFLAARLAPQDARTNYAIGLYYQDLDQFQKASLYYDRIPQNSPWHQPTLFIKARYLSFHGQNQQEAQKIFQTLAQQNPASEIIWQSAAEAARHRGDLNAALNAYQKAIDLKPQDAQLYFSLAVILDQIGRKNETENALRQAIKLDPQNASALNYLGYWLLEEGRNPNEALNLIKGAIQKYPQNAYFIDSLGWGQYKLGQFQKAANTLERAVSLRPLDPILTDHLGDAYHKLNRNREAVYHWQHALTLNPDDTLKTQIISKLQQEENTQ